MEASTLNSNAPPQNSTAPAPNSQEILIANSTSPASAAGGADALSSKITEDFSHEKGIVDILECPVSVFLQMLVSLFSYRGSDMPRFIQGSL